MSGVFDLFDGLGVDPDKLGVVIVDHGSKRDESNALLLKMVERFQALTGLAIVEPAHMELAEPSIDAAFEKAVAAGARRIVVAPFFLAPGRHMHEDIPRLVAEAAARRPGVTATIAAPLGSHTSLVKVLCDRVRESLEG